MVDFRFIEPLDALYLRGNKLFGDPGSFGESLVPPWPSIAAGAIRSWMLTEASIDPAAFARGDAPHAALGIPGAPGPFTVTAFHLARAVGADVQTLHQPPADLAVFAEDEGVWSQRLRPTLPASGLESSAPTGSLAVLGTQKRNKGATGLWLTQAGWERHLCGQDPAKEHWIQAGSLWATETRVGVGLSVETGRADDGKLFSMQAVMLNDGLGERARFGRVGFLVGVAGAALPAQGMLRFGGDGRAAAIGPARYTPTRPAYDAIAHARRCRLILTSPGIFPDGWRLPGTDADGKFDLAGVRGRVVCAAVPRAEVVSGFDIAKRHPKDAERAAPAGSVYWLEDVEADAAALGKLAEHGLWPDSAQNSPRRSEGFNRCVLAVY